MKLIVLWVKKKYDYQSRKKDFIMSLKNIHSYTFNLEYSCREGGVRLQKFIFIYIYI